MKTLFIQEAKKMEKFEEQFMVYKILNEQENRLVVILGDQTGDMKAAIKNYKQDLEIGDVIQIEGVNDRGLEIENYEKAKDYDLNDFLPSVDNLDGILEELEQLTEEEITSKHCKQLNDYFFKDEKFMERFKKGIGGLVQHHNYRGGLVEHTLNVMYLTKLLAKRYDSSHKELVILAAKLHDIGKIEEYYTDGPFSVTMRGDMEGHIVLGLAMIEEALLKGGDIYTEEFKHRLRGCIVQHHGKVEYGSPKAANTQEAYILNLADTTDAIMNKIEKLKKVTEPNTWSEYDRRIGTRIFF